MSNLKNPGYAVIDADNKLSALTGAGEGHSIDLLLTDVGLSDEITDARLPTRSGAEF